MAQTMFSMCLTLYLWFVSWCAIWRIYLSTLQEKRCHVWKPSRLLPYHQIRSFCIQHTRQRPWPYSRFDFLLNPACGIFRLDCSRTQIIPNVEEGSDREEERETRGEETWASISCNNPWGKCVNDAFSATRHRCDTHSRLAYKRLSYKYRVSSSTQHKRAKCWIQYKV